MGYHRHHALIVTSWHEDHLGEAHAKASEIYAKTAPGGPGEDNLLKLVGHIMPGTTNGYASFTIVPDGSKEGWDTSMNSDAARTEFIEWLRGTGYYHRPGTDEEGGRLYLDWVEVEFGGDEPQFTKLLAHSGDEEWRKA